MGCRGCVCYAYYWKPSRLHGAAQPAAAGQQGAAQCNSRRDALAAATHAPRPQDLSKRRSVMTCTGERGAARPEAVGLLYNYPPTGLALQLHANKLSECR